MKERYLLAEGLCLDRQDARVLVDGKPVRLGARAFDLLTVLMERPQVLVTKDELFARVWSGVTVSDAVLTTAVKELRQAIGDNARQPRYIETAHGRGYRFLPAVEALSILPGVVDQVPPDATRWPPQRLLALAAVLASLFIAGALIVWPRISPSPALAPRSIVVMPFEDLSPGGDQRWFADGLAEELQTTLARTPDLRTVSRLSAARLVRSGSSEQEAASQLGADQFLEGAVRRSGDRIRVTVKLLRAEDGSQIWANSYDRSASDVIEIQEDIAFHVASSLSPAAPRRQIRALVGAGTHSSEAYEAYLRGLAMDQRQFEEGDLDFATAAADAYELARVLDPTFAAAHWKAADTWFGNQTRLDASTRGSVSDEVRLARHIERLDAAIANSRDDVERLKYRAARAAMDLELVTARRLMEQYVRARPRDTDAWEELADLSAYSGDRAGMRRAAGQVHQLSLEEGEPRSRAITISVMAMDLDVAVRYAREQLAQRPEQAVTQYQAHRAYIWAGRFDEARRLLPPIRTSGLAPATRLLAEMRQACAEGRQAEALRLKSQIDATGNLNTRWLAAALAGDARGAVALLRPLDREGSLPNLMQYMINPGFDARQFPVLHDRLTRNGVRPHLPAPIPHACPPRAAGASLAA
ncbi:hypothetical protein GCM10009422_24790 [Brevundimonas kwangchunensis]|uniref:OmpR/PhoB-type domain-containing protein n=1 Tax=Brevundimonas kwangchunensis TaxID=322163 RepID=A0ABN1H2R7_9CAUL